MSYADLLNILQLGEVQLDPPGGKIRLYDGSVVNPLGSYTFSVSRNSGPKCKIKLSWRNCQPVYVEHVKCYFGPWRAKSTNKFKTRKFEMTF